MLYQKQYLYHSNLITITLNRIKLKNENLRKIYRKSLNVKNTTVASAVQQENKLNNYKVFLLLQIKIIIHIIILMLVAIG